MPWNSQNVTSLLIINAAGGFTGLFVYTPTPGTGNLITNVTATAGTDPYGNAYLPNVTVTRPGTTQRIQLTASGPVVLEQFYSGTASEAQPGQLKAGAINIGLPGEQQQLIMGAPINSASNDGTFVDLLSSTAAAPNTGLGTLAYQPSTGGPLNFQVQWGAQGVYRQSQFPLAGGIPFSRMDVFSRSATTLALTALTNTYAIPANDPFLGNNQNTTYRIRAWGTGTEAAPAVAGSFSVTGFGSTLAVANITPAGSGQTFQWKLECTVMVSATGVAGSCIDEITWTALTSGGTGGAFTAVGGPTVINTTVASNIVLNWQWGSITGGPSITCIGSVFTREGS